MSTLLSENFDAITVGTQPPTGWTQEGTTGVWSVQTAPAGLSGRVARTAQQTSDAFIKKTFTRQTSGVVTVNATLKTGSNVTSGRRWGELELHDGAAAYFAALGLVNGQVRLVGLAVTNLVALVANTVYVLTINADLAADKVTSVVVNGTTYDNAGAGWAFAAATSGFDLIRLQAFSTNVVGGEFIHADAITVTNTAATPGAGTLGAGTVDEYGRVTMTFTEGTGTTASLKVYRSNDGVTFADVTTTCTTTDNGSTWTVTDRRPHYGSESVAYGGTAYYKVVAVDGLDESPDSNTVTVAAIDVDIDTIAEDRAAWLSSYMAGSFVASVTAEKYPGYTITATAYAYFRWAVAQHKTDALNQFAYVQTLDTADGLIQLPGDADASSVFRDSHCRTVIHCAIAARLLQRAGATSDAQTVIDQCDIWAKAFFDNLNSGNPAPTKTVAGWDAGNASGANQQLPWVAATAYGLGAIVRPTSTNARTYRATTAGTSHATTQPTWPTTAGGTVTDGTVTWAETTVTVAVSYSTYSASAGHAPTVTGKADVNQNVQEGLMCALLLTDPTSDFYPAGAYRTEALSHVTDQVKLALVHETSTGAIPLGEVYPASNGPEGYDTLYGNYVLQLLSAIQALLPTLNSYLPGYIERGLAYSIDNFYDVEPITSTRWSVGVGAPAQFYDLVYLDAAAGVAGVANPQSKLVWTAAFQKAATDKVGAPYTVLGDPPTTIADQAQAEMFDGLVWPAALPLAQTVAPTGIASTSAVGTPALTEPVAPALEPTGIASTSTVGTPSLTQPAFAGTVTLAFQAAHDVTLRFTTAPDDVTLTFEAAHDVTLTFA